MVLFTKDGSVHVLEKLLEILPKERSSSSESSIFFEYPACDVGGVGMVGGVGEGMGGMGGVRGVMKGEGEDEDEGHLMHEYTPEIRSNNNNNNDNSNINNGGMNGIDGVGRKPLQFDSSESGYIIDTQDTQDSSNGGEGEGEEEHEEEVLTLICLKLFVILLYCGMKRRYLSAVYVQLIAMLCSLYSVYWILMHFLLITAQNLYP